MIKFSNKETHCIEIKNLNLYTDVSINLTENIKKAKSMSKEVDPSLSGYPSLILRYDSIVNKFKVSYKGTYICKGSFRYLDAFYRYSDGQIYSIEISNFSESRYIKNENMNMILNFNKFEDEDADGIINKFIVELKRIKSSFKQELEKNLEDGIRHLEFLESTFPYTTEWRLEKIFSSLKISGQVNPAVSFISAYIQALEKVPIRFEIDIPKPLSYAELPRREIPPTPYCREEKLRYQQVRKLERQLQTLRRALEIQKENTSPLTIYKDYPVYITKIEETVQVLNAYVKTGDTSTFDRIDSLIKVIGGFGGAMILAGSVAGATISAIKSILEGIKALWGETKYEIEPVKEEVERPPVWRSTKDATPKTYKEIIREINKRDPACYKIIRLIAQNPGRNFSYSDIASRVNCTVEYAGDVIRILRHSRLLQRLKMSPAIYYIKTGLSEEEACYRMGRTWSKKRYDQN